MPLKAACFCDKIDVSYSHPAVPLHFMGRWGKKKEEEVPLWLAVRQCGDLT